MVNEDFEKFNKVQHAHQGEYLGTERGRYRGINDKQYNNQEITDKAIGAVGRDTK